jgi:serine/threonine protein kinase
MIYVQLFLAFLFLQQAYSFKIPDLSSISKFFKGNKKACKRNGGVGSCVHYSEPNLALLLSKDPVAEAKKKPTFEIGGKTYKVSEHLGQGAFGITFGAKEISGEKRDVVIKLLKAPDVKYPNMYQNEKTALEKTGMLIAAGGKTAALVQTRIHGETLLDVLQKTKDQNEINRLRTEYLKLGEKFKNKYGLIHNDIAPRNVIIDKKTGKLRLIDYGLSRLYEKDKKGDKRLANQQLRAIRELDMVLGKGKHMPMPDRIHTNTGSSTPPLKFSSSYQASTSAQRASTPPLKDRTNFGRGDSGHGAKRQKINHTGRRSADVNGSAGEKLYSPSDEWCRRGGKACTKKLKTSKDKLKVQQLRNRRKSNTKLNNKQLKDKSKKESLKRNAIKVATKVKNLVKKHISPRKQQSKKDTRKKTPRNTIKKGLSFISLLK